MLNITYVPVPLKAVLAAVAALASPSSVSADLTQDLCPVEKITLSNNQDLY